MAGLGQIDSDGDGLSDAHEVALGTDPQEADGDGDNISDGEEILNYGTNPYTATTPEELSQLHITQPYNQEVLPPGQQVFTGRGEPGSTIIAYMIDDIGQNLPIGEAEVDETGKYQILTEALAPGDYSVFTTSVGGYYNVVEDLSQFLKLSVADSSPVATPQPVEGSLKNGQVLEAADVELSLKVDESKNDRLVYVTWQSALYSQTLIADADEENISTQPPTALPAGKHEVTWYVVDTEENFKSSPERLSFNVRSVAFLSGDTQGQGFVKIVLGGVIVFFVISLFALMLRRKPEVRN